jgi:hypothetical protein
VEIKLLKSLGRRSAGTVLLFSGLVGLGTKHIPDVNYNLVRVTAGDKAVVAASYQGPKLSDELATFNLRGATHSGIGGAGSSGQDAPHIDVERVAFRICSGHFERELVFDIGHPTYLP